ncbi:type 1 glutamine amidotransferase domain-containing protein [Humibacillus xanthopallidus]|uniref:Putative intracellular protease/amidase n=1 Tax=Humibacillus xanthopallidus TaxID=412689 RepID=A0A543HTX9_9MICO|nr:type 1 glutamine amidotransferase domain-containing protein [Humibacillus xanthopallidus]TQM61752.1 putative intracellular protease/amidase [Humibacillus xanthopallidus]
MSGTIDVHGRPKRVLLLASNPAVSSTTGWPVGFWWAELTHPYWEFVEAGYEVTVASPDGGALQADSWSDPSDESGYSAHDLLSRGFIASPEHAALVQDTPSLASLDVDAFDAVFLVGGQAPMFTFRHDSRVKELVGGFLADGKVAAVVCHATCVLLDATLPDGELVVAGRTWTGFANSEERYADDYVGTRIQPFWIDDEARVMTGTNFIVHERFRPHAVRHGNLVTGQQQYSGAAAARLVIDALGR